MCMMFIIKRAHHPAPASDRRMYKCKKDIEHTSCSRTETQRPKQNITDYMQKRSVVYNMRT